MKRLSLLTLLSLASVILPSCSLVERWGIANTRMRVLDEHRETVGDREFLVRRYLVNRDTGETFSESLQIVDQRFAGSPTTVERTDVLGGSRYTDESQ